MDGSPSGAARIGPALETTTAENEHSSDTVAITCLSHEDVED
ncbi:hypothetical protein [Natrinema gelatinilyticum]|nr:hypothetical protein [Natrinema gelatinilyticum]